MAQKFNAISPPVWAVQFTGRNQAEVFRFIYGDLAADDLQSQPEMWLPIVCKQSGAVSETIPINHFVIRHTDRSFFTLPPDLFALRYQPAIPPEVSQ